MSSTPDDWLTATQASLGICVPDSNTSSAVSPMLAPLLLAVPPRGFAFLEALRLLGARAFQLLPLARDLGQHQLQPVGHRGHAADPQPPFFGRSGCVFAAAPGASAPAAPPSSPGAAGSVSDSIC